MKADREKQLERERKLEAAAEKKESCGKEGLRDEDGSSEVVAQGARDEGGGGGERNTKGKGKGCGRDNGSGTSKRKR